MTIDVIPAVAADDIYWMAGVLDLQGALAHKDVATRQSGRQGCLFVESKQLQVVAKLGRMTGTNPEPRTPKIKDDYLRRPCTEHCDDAHCQVEPDQTFKPRTRWGISGAGAAVVLYSVMPHMRTDRGFRDFQRYIYANTPTDGPGTGTIFKQLRRLINLGWIIPPEYEIFKQKIEEDP